MEIEEKNLTYWKGKIAEAYALLGEFLKMGGGYDIEHPLALVEREGERPLIYYLYVSDRRRLRVAAKNAIFDKDLEELEDPLLLELALSDLYGLLESYRIRLSFPLAKLQTIYALAEEAQKKLQGGLSPEESEQRLNGLLKQINAAGECAMQFV